MRRLREKIFRSKVIVIAALLVLPAAVVSAANLRVCYKVNDPDTIVMRLYAGPTMINGDIFGGTTPDVNGVRCAITALPTTQTRGQTLDYTIRGVNGFGEEGPASAPVAFRAPIVPSVPTAVSVGPVATP